MVKLTTALLLVSVAAVGLLYFHVLSAMRCGYVPAWSDEYAYVANARSFCENTTLHDVFVMREYVTKQGFSGHGFAYTLFDGLVAKMLGFHYTNALVTNVMLIALSLLLIYKLKRVALYRRLAACLLILMYFTVLLYSATYSTELLQLLIGVVLSTTLYKAYAESGKILYIFSYIVMVCIAAVFRQSWGMWAIGILPLAKSWKGTAVYAFVFMLVMGWSFAVVRVFVAFPFGALEDINTLVSSGNIPGIIRLFWSRFTSNAVLYFTATYSPHAFYFWCKYLIVILSLVFTAYGFLFRNRMSLACGLIGCGNVLFLLVFFDAFHWREHRMLAPVFYLFAVYIACCAPALVWLAVGAFLVVIFPGAMRQTREFVAMRKAVALKYAGQPDLVNAFAGLSNLIEDCKLNTVLAAKVFFRDEDVILLALPVRSRNGYPIRYTWNLFYPHEYQLWNRLDVNYILAERCLGENGLPVVATNRYFWLYRSSTLANVVTNNYWVDGHLQRRVNLVRNASFADGLRFWTAFNPSNEVWTAQEQDARATTFLVIGNPHGEFAGVRQDVRLESGTVYRLSATARSVITNNSQLGFGARVFCRLPSQEERELVWMSEFNSWWDKHSVWTNAVAGQATIGVHLGYGGYAATGEFTNVCVEELKSQ
jgi:hypothetical protein